MQQHLISIGGATEPRGLGRLASGYRRLVLSLVWALVVGAVLFVAARAIDRAGLAFYERGRATTETLAAIAASLRAADFEAVSSRFAVGYQGAVLGLGSPVPNGERDGVRAFLFVPPGGVTNRAQALEEWRQYLASFEEIEELVLHVHRIEEHTEDNLVALARFELIGTATGEPRPGIDRAFLRLRLEASESGLAVAAAELIEGERLVADTPHFVNVGSEAGIDFENRYYPAFLDQPLAFGMLRYGPAGITAADIDSDGFYDLFIPDGVESRLYRNLGDGSFENITAAAGLGGLDGVSVGLFADYDNDGDKDFFVSRTFEPNQLFRNEGDGTFTDVTRASGLAADCCTTVGSWGDIDNDGDLDLYVGRYLDPRLAIPTTFYARNGEPNQLYRNDGDGTFTNVTESSGTGEVGLCLGTVFGDYDDDGDADLYVANDFGRKTLYRNRGDGTYEDVTVQSGTLAYGAGMSASFGDVDNDGLLDLYVAHIRSEHGWFAEAPTVWRYMLNTWRQGVWKSDMPLYFEIFRQSGFGFVEVFQQMASGNTLLRNRGDGSFEDVTWVAAANPPGWFWGSGFADFDNDGWQDIYSANGWVYNDRGTEIELGFLNGVVSEMRKYKRGDFFQPEHFGRESWHGWERNRHLRNQGDGTFREIGRPAGSDLLLNSRGTAFADFWNRGVVDIAVAASTGRHALLRNQVGERRGWLEVELVGGAGRLDDGTNRDAVGARVTARVGDLLLTREVALGDGYGSQNALRLHFGLGEAEVVDELRVWWPRSKREQRFERVAANRIVEVVEGRDELATKSYAPPGGIGS